MEGEFTFARLGYMAEASPNYYAVPGAGFRATHLSQQAPAHSSAPFHSDSPPTLQSFKGSKGRRSTCCCFATRGGCIGTFVLLVLLLIASLVICYFFVTPFHAWVQAKLIRG